MTEQTARTTSTSLAEALAAFQAEAPTFKKSKTAKVQTRTGGEYSYRYADLGDILPVVGPLLGKHGLSWSAKPGPGETGELVLRYRLLHVSGEVDEGEMPLGVERNCKPQELGSAITYARRYALTAQLNLATEEDDDGRTAQGSERSNGGRKTAEPEPAPELPEETFNEVVAAIKAAQMPPDWTRMHLVAFGAQDVPEGPIMRSTILALTPEQATQLIALCKETVEAREKAQARNAEKKGAAKS